MLCSAIIEFTLATRIRLLLCCSHDVFSIIQDCYSLGYNRKIISSIELHIYFIHELSDSLLIIEGSDDGIRKWGRKGINKHG